MEGRGIPPKQGQPQHLIAEGLEGKLHSGVSLVHQDAGDAKAQHRLFHLQVLDKFCREKICKGKGPKIVCLDQSGSTAGENAVWGKAVAYSVPGTGRSPAGWRSAAPAPPASGPAPWGIPAQARPPRPG